MSKTYEEILAGATTIKNERSKGANSASRIGQQFVDQADYTKDVADRTTDLELEVDEVKNEVFVSEQKTLHDTSRITLEKGYVKADGSIAGESGAYRHTPKLTCKKGDIFSISRTDGGKYGNVRFVSFFKGGTALQSSYDSSSPAMPYTINVDADEVFFSFQPTLGDVVDVERQHDEIITYSQVQKNKEDINRIEEDPSGRKINKLLFDWDVTKNDVFYKLGEKALAIKAGTRFFVNPSSNFTHNRSNFRLYINGKYVYQSMHWQELCLDYDVTSIDVGITTSDTSSNKVMSVEVSIVEQEATCRTNEHIQLSDSEEVILQKLLNAVINGNVDVYFERGDYTLNNVYEVIGERNEYRELPIGGNCRYYLNGSVLSCNFNGSVDDRYNTSTVGCRYTLGTYELHDGTIKCVGNRYCVHDEREGSYIPYANKYIGVNMIYEDDDVSASSSRLNNKKCIGGGLGKKAHITIDRCRFDGNLESGQAHVAYHSSALKTGEDNDYITMMITNSVLRSLSINKLTSEASVEIGGSLMLCNNIVDGKYVENTIDVTQFGNVASTALTIEE